MTMSKIPIINQNKVPKTRGALKQSGTNEMAKGKRQCKSSRCLTEDKENTPPVFTRLRSRCFKTVNNNFELSPSCKTKKQEKKNEVERNYSRTPLKPVKEEPVKKGTKKDRLTLNVSPIHRPKSVSNSGRNDISRTLLASEKTEDDTLFSHTLLPVEETKDESVTSVSHIVFRRKSSTTTQKEVCMLTSSNPPLDYWKMLAEQRLNAMEKTLHQNELMYDQLSVLEAENSQLKEMVKQAKKMILIIQSTL